MKFLIHNMDEKKSLLVQGVPTLKNDGLELFPSLKDAAREYPKFREVLRPGEKNEVELPEDYLIGLEIL